VADGAVQQGAAGPWRNEPLHPDTPGIHCAHHAHL